MLLKGKKALIFGVANQKSIAYGIAKEFLAQGAEIALSYPGDAIKKRVEPIAEELKTSFIFPCDVTSDEQIEQSVKDVQSHWQNIDILVHSVAFAHKEDLHNRYVDTTREGFRTALDISAYSLVALCKAYEKMFNPNSYIMTMTYYGAQKYITNYNVMGVAKAALEASVRYLSYEMGMNGHRVNAISAGPIKTLAASGISDFRTILDRIESNAPLKRNTTIEDVGGAAAFFASDLSRAVTGEVLFVDCGYNILGI